MAFPRSTCYTPLLWCGIVSALRLLPRQRVRLASTLLAMALAVGTVTVMVSIGAGALQTVRDHVAAEGINILYVLPKPRLISGVRTSTASGSLTVEDALDLKRSIPEVRETCWWRQDPTQLVHGHENWLARVLSISPGCQSVKGWLPRAGREITDLDFEHSRQVALLGHTVVRRLFGDADPIGSTIRIRQVPFSIIGVLEEKGFAPGGYDQDDIVLIPYSTARHKLLGKTESYVEVIAAATYEREELPEAAASVKSLLRARHRLEPEAPDDILVRTQLEIEHFYEEAGATFGELLVMLAAISLLVGGIGIMNILLVSVTERTREIGVRMAVGAKRRHILIQFLIEAMTLSLVGGCIGILLGIAGARLTTVIAGWPTIISTQTVATAFVFSVAVGLFFGLYPANKASRLNPIDALRYE